MAAAARGMLAFWMGGAGAVTPTSTAGVRSLLAPWMGGATPGPSVDPPAPPPPAPSLGGGGKRGDSDRWHGWPKETAAEKPALSTLEIEAKRRRRDEDDMMLTIIIQAVTKGLL